MLHLGAVLIAEKRQGCGNIDGWSLAINAIVRIEGRENCGLGLYAMRHKIIRQVG